MKEPELLDLELERVMLSVGIPPRPSILLELAEESKKDDPNFHHIEHLVSSDVGLSAALLKTINSPFYGLRNKAGNIKQAIGMLGVTALTRVTSGMMVRKVFTAPGKINMERFWDASAKVALTTSYIAKQLPGMNRDEAYTFGLFQDCGIPVLMQRFPDYKETLGIANQTPERKFTDIEGERYNANHATTGYLLTKSWNMPEYLSSAIRFHHEHAMLADPQSSLPKESKNLIAMALLAERAVQLHSGMNNSVEWLKGGKTALFHLGLTESKFETIVADIKNIFEEEEE